MVNIPTPVYNRQKARQTARQRTQDVNRGNVQRHNATMLESAQRHYKKAPTKQVQNVIQRRIDNLSKRPLR
jgi:hypothetical protein